MIMTRKVALASVSALTPKAAVEVIWDKWSASDPKRPFIRHGSFKQCMVGHSSEYNRVLDYCHCSSWAAWSGIRLRFA